MVLFTFENLALKFDAGKRKRARYELRLRRAVDCASRLCENPTNKMETYTDIAENLSVGVLHENNRLSHTDTEHLRVFYYFIIALVFIVF